MNFLFVLLLWTKLVSSSHFNGGTITWQPLNSSDTTSPVAIVITQTYSWVYTVVSCNQTAIATQTPINTVYNNNDVVGCISSCSASYGYNSVPIARYCTDFSPILGLTDTQRTDVVQLSANASFSIAFSPAGLAWWRPLALSSSATISTATWSITTTINLQKRTDNGLVNTAPIANVISPIEIPLNMPEQITIPVIDANNDIVRCRWAQRTPINECMDVCPPASLPVGVSLSTNCTLYITGTVNNSWYVAALMVEDFIDASSTTPLSSVPVQFLIHVVQPANCSVLPQVTGLNVTNMACIGVQTAAQYTSTLFITNYCGASVTIVAVSVQSFPGMVTGPLTTINSSLYSMSLTWTPTPSQIGLQMLCAITKDSQNQRSLQFCLVFSVADGGAGSCPGNSPVTTSITTLQEFTSVAVTNASVTTNQAVTTEAMITTTEQFTTAEIVTNMNTENITYSSTALSVIQSIFTTTSGKIPGSTINLPLIISLSLLALLLALLCCFCYLYHLLWGAGRRRRRKQISDVVDPPKNKKYLLQPARRITSQAQERLPMRESSISQPLRSSRVEDDFEKSFTPKRSIDTSHLNKPIDSRTTSLHGTTADSHVTILRPSQAEIPMKKSKTRISDTSTSTKIIRVSQISTAVKDKKIIEPINETRTQLETDPSYPNVTRVSIMKETKIRSTGATSKNHENRNSNTIIKKDDGISVAKLPQIKRISHAQRKH